MLLRYFVSLFTSTNHSLIILIKILYFGAFFLACDCYRTKHRTNEMLNKSFRIYFLTYNVNSKDPSNLDQLFGLQTHKNVDAYVISLQELPYSALFADYWRKECENVLAKEGFVLLAGETMTVTSLMVFVPKNRIIEFYKVDKSYVNFDMLYRKGAIGIRFFWNGLTFCFIGSHFVPHDYNYEKRNDNYHAVLNQMSFKSKDHILNHDFVFWLGDLNYRINSINSSEIKQFIEIASKDSKEDRYKNLIAYDQLKQAKDTRMAFDEFNEAPINFAPTYKFIIDSQSYNDQRKPAYTDRILFRSAIEKNSSAFIDLHAYTSLRAFTISDHKPVCLIANIPETAGISKSKVIETSKIRRSKRSILSQSLPVIEKRVATMAIERDSLDRNAEEAQEQHPDVGFHENLEQHLYEEPPLQRRQLTAEDNQDELIDLLEPDNGTLMSRKLRINFEPVRNWSENTPKNIRFRITDSETNDSIQPYPELFRSVLSEWDYIGLLREDWQERDEYVSFVYPNFNFIEEAREAGALDGGDSDESTSDSESHLSVSYIKSETDSAQNRPSTSSSIPSTTRDTPDTIVHRQSKMKSSEEDESNDEEFVDAQLEEYSYSASFGNESTLLAPPGRYQLLYYRSNGDVLGISDPFEISYNRRVPDFPE